MYQIRRGPFARMNFKQLLLGSYFGSYFAIAAAGDSPQQVHIAYYAEAVEITDGMTVSWVTQSETDTSTVQFGLSPTSLVNTATGEQIRYLSAKVNGTVNHHVSLTGLALGTVYFYRCGDADAGWSQVLNFTTAPEPGKEQWPLSWTVYGDMGDKYNSAATFLDIARLFPATLGIWHVGDISYADDSDLLPLPDPFFEYEAYYNDVSICGCGLQAGASKLLLMWG